MCVVAGNDSEGVILRDVLLQLRKKPVGLHPMDAVCGNDEFELVRTKIGVFRVALDPSNV
ncbi:hypothetical protein FF80_01394 [Devosia sp. LC5]|nr:hypothetical protein FF80_01394 [Devosia sp. LC5]